MSDLVERLREDARGGFAYHELSDEAADEIERLRALRPPAASAESEQQLLNLPGNTGAAQGKQGVGAVDRTPPLGADPTPPLSARR